MEYKEGIFVRKGLLFIFTIVLVFLPFSINADAHPGKTDADGGHTCHTNCAKWGLKDGQYHYHNADGSVSLTKPSTSKPTAPSATNPNPLVVYINGMEQTIL